ncbi:hypothetical protein CH267_02075 [Rhodococcus sp. 06-621-2]|nr:hypothetical protein [Rhodococcus sp. 06-621-2]OZC62346.1 hypothetical protein CH267_02075 [Rhodococcus sp. 06-621-2]
MTFIVRKFKPENSQAIEYDVVADAKYAEADSSGHLTLSSGGRVNRTVAVYAAGQWHSSFESGQVRQGRDDKIYTALTAESLLTPPDQTD